MAKTCGELAADYRMFSKELRYDLDCSYDEVCRVDDGWPTPTHIYPEKREYGEKVLKFIAWAFKTYPTFLNENKGYYIELYKFTHYLRTQVSCKMQELDALRLQPSLFENEKEEEKKKVLEQDIKKINYFLKVIPYGSKYFKKVYL